MRNTHVKILRLSCSFFDVRDLATESQAAGPARNEEAVGEIEVLNIGQIIIMTYRGIRKEAPSHYLNRCFTNQAELRCWPARLARLE